MNKKHFLTKIAVFGLFSSSLLSGNIANAQMESEVDKVINRSGNWEIQDRIRSEYHELERLRIDCDYGDTQACTEYQEKVNAPDPEFDEMMQNLEHQLNDSILYGR